MNLLFIGTCLSPSLREQLNSEHIPLDIAALTLQEALLKGFHENNIIISSVISIPSIYSRKKIYVKREFFSDNYCSHNISLPFINVLGLKQLLTPFFVKKYLDTITVEPDCIYIYMLTSASLRIAKMIKRKFPNCKVLMHIADLPEFVGPETNIRRYLKNIESFICKKYINIVDGFVLLSKYMIHRLPVKNKPFIVSEGIFSGDILCPTSTSSLEKTILYSGTLHEGYGIFNLIRAFLSLPNPDYRLLICGSGDCEKKLIDMIKSDKRISYLGVLSRSEVLKLQRSVSLLVNPRGSEGEYTKYSFPSKTIEYFASGTPVLLCKLPAIPNEYYKYCFVAENNNADVLAGAINTIFQHSNDSLKNLGESARNFILREKNPQSQVGRILDFYNSL